jgi:hypothetical protein
MTPTSFDAPEIRYEGGHAAAERQVVSLLAAGLEELADVVEGRRAGGIRGSEVLIRAVPGPGDAERAARPVDRLNIRFCTDLADSEAVAVLESADPRVTAFRRDDDRAVGGIDAVERRRFRPLEHRQRLDVVGIDVGRAVGEVDVGIAEGERR